MSGPDFIYLPSNVEPGQIVDLSVNLVAPDVAGKYEGNWQFEDPNGKIFGVGNSADQPIWARISVILPSINTITITPTPSSIASPTGTPISQYPVAYDFVGNACMAQWENSHEFLPCPGLDGDKKGFVLPLNQAKLEDSTVMNLATLLTFPESVKGGSIQGIYPDYLVQAGDHLQGYASCEYGARACSVLFRISYIDSSGSINDLWAVGEFYDGMYSNANIDLSYLAGMKVKFVLSVLALGSPVDDQALWIAPHIVHIQTATPTATNIATATYTPSPEPTATSTYTPIPPSIPTHNLTSTPPAGGRNPASPPSITETINQIILFFQRLLSH